MDEEVGAVTPLAELLSAKADGAAKPEPAIEAETVIETPVEAVKPPDPPSPQPSAPEPAMVPVQSYHAEKSKRQELEARLADLEAKAKGLQQPKPLDVFDPEFGPTIERQLAQQDWQNRITLSRGLMRAQHTDFEDAEKVYLEEFAKGRAPDVPRDHQSPAEFVYEIGKQLALVRETGGDLKSYESKLRDKIKAELEAEATKKAEAKRAAIMPTSAGERSATPDKGDEGWSPKPLTELLRKKRA